MPMPLIKKILFPVDFSDSCVSAARYVEALAGRFEAEVRLFHVVGRGEHTLAEELLPQRQAQLNSFLAGEFKYFSTQRVCVMGDEPAPVIADAAQRWGADLVMMPTHGLGVFQRLFLGSVTAKVLSGVDCPVWTSVHAEAAPRLEDIHCRRILCALDLTERSPNVLAWAGALAAECDASLGIVHATAPMPPADIPVGLDEELTESVSKQARSEIDNLQKTAGTAAQVFIDSGDPASVVASAAKDFDADLLIIGRHESGHQDAYAVIRNSPCPVISI